MTLRTRAYFLGFLAPAGNGGDRRCGRHGFTNKAHVIDRAIMQTGRFWQRWMQAM